MGSMIEYRLQKKPGVSISLQIKEHPYRKPHEHGMLLYRVVNSSFLQSDAVKEEAQGVAWDMAKSGFVLEQPLKVSDLKDALTAKTLKELQRVFSGHDSTRQAFKAMLRDVHVFLTRGKPGDAGALLAPKAGGKK